jgi:hypothetical protein
MHETMPPKERRALTVTVRRAHRAREGWAGPRQSPGAGIGLAAQKGAWARLAEAPPSSATARPLSAPLVLALQRSIGNRAVSRLVEEERGFTLQRSEVDDVLASPGHTLPQPARSLMEASLQVPPGSFASVAVHDAPQDLAVSRSLGARAFTTGEHIVGDVSAPHTLAHELTHVLQQRRGSVSGIDVGGGLRVSDPGDRFEREAADRARATTTAGGVAPAYRPHDPAQRGVATPRSGSSDIPIQRDIGFEFELGYVRTYTRPYGSWIGRWRKPLKKGQVIVPGDDFDITADDPPSTSTDSLSDLEIIIHHLDDRKEGSRDRLARIAQKVLRVVRSLPRNRSDLRAWPLLSKRADKDVYLETDATPNNGTLQATAGLSLNALVNIRSGRTFKTMDDLALSLSKNEVTQNDADTLRLRDKLPWAERSGNNPEAFDCCLTAIDDSFEALPEASRPMVAAILSVMIEVPLNARLADNPPPYPKATAGSLMARTDFATIVRQLPSTVRQTIAEGDAFTEAALTAINRLLATRGWEPVTRRSPVFPAEFPTPHVSRPQITLGEWFDGIHAKGLQPGTDRLTRQGYQAEQAWWFRRGSQAAALESMGAFGAQTDPGTRPGQRRPIFEMRTLTPENTTCSAEKLADACLAIWDFVAQAHAADQSSGR